MSLKSLINTGTKIWLDSIEPELVKKNRAAGATGATSNPIIVSDIIKGGKFDGRIRELISQKMTDSQIAWQLTDELVRNAQDVFLPVWQESKGNNGYVSFELDPLLEDKAMPIPVTQAITTYIELGKKWSAGHQNRMIKVPATPAGLGALEELAAHGITLNVTLIFSMRQYKAARDAVWRGAQRRKNGLADFKSVYSIFISRVDVYTEKNAPDLTPEAQGIVGIVNAKRLYMENKQFWASKNLRLQQEMIFASTGTKKKTDPADKYVEAMAGSDIETNPPSTNDAVEALNKNYVSHVNEMPAQVVLDEIDIKVDAQKMENTLMEEGLAKFADPQHALLKLIADKRASV